MWPFKREPPSDEPSEATLARIKAERDLRSIKAETPAYQALADRLRELREENNFAAAFRNNIQRGRL